ncbi:hypothetical protein SK128_027074 [Halocaridina rubra]|uniref:Uncharacterized protein n=1 Tax=Halocaridina rubra TaxID=373956 RepID=A0AAN8WII3_HALRR
MNELFAAIDWRTLFYNKSVQEMYDIFCEKYGKIGDRSIPSNYRPIALTSSTASAREDPLVLSCPILLMYGHLL